MFCGEQVLVPTSFMELGTGALNPWTTRSRVHDKKQSERSPYPAITTRIFTNYLIPINYILI